MATSLLRPPLSLGPGFFSIPSKSQSLHFTFEHSLALQIPHSKLKNCNACFLPGASTSNSVGFSRSSIFSPVLINQSLHGKKLTFRGAPPTKCVAKLESLGENSDGETSLQQPLQDELESQDDDMSKKDRKNFFWRKVKETAKDGHIYDGKVEGSNSGGLIIFFGVLRCFLPFSQIDPARLQSVPGKGISEIAEGLIGKTISCKIIDINEREGRIILSEKSAILQKRMQEVKEGEVYEGKVSSIVDFGIFADILFPDGSSPVTGLIHMSEISWDPVKDIHSLFNLGDKITVKVIRVDMVRERIALSLKQLKNDPLLETLDNILPLNDESGDNSINSEITNDEETENLLKLPLPGLDNICQELLKEDGVLEVRVGRKAIERKVVSQDLELWLSNVKGDDGNYTILARAGRQVQEIYINTNLKREEMKKALQMVTTRVI